MKKHLNKLQKNLTLKELEVSNITNFYVSWLNDYDLVKFTEQRFKRFIP